MPSPFCTLDNPDTLRCAAPNDLPHLLFPAAIEICPTLCTTKPAKESPFAPRCSAQLEWGFLAQHGSRMFLVSLLASYFCFLPYSGLWKRFLVNPKKQKQVNKPETASDPQKARKLWPRSMVQKGLLLLALQKGASWCKGLGWA